MTVSPSGIGDPTAVTPPASVPLGFLSAAGAGLVGFGFVTWFAADRLVASPTHPGVVSAVHLGVLAFLTMAVLGALHQFGPVVGRRPIRSVPAARISLATMVLAAWLLPNGFAHGPEWMVLAGGLLGTVTVLIVAWNLSAPLSSRDGGVPVAGLRISMAYLLLTVGFGLVYVLNRRAGWFPLLPNRVLAHAHLGLLGWLGLSYVAVSEKLWPMFLLSHRPSVRSGRVAVTAIGAGVLPLAMGLLLASPVVTWVGGGLVSIGLAAHVVTLAACVRHRRRPLELLHWFLFSSTLFLLIGVGFGAVAAVADVAMSNRATLVAAEVGGLIAWLSLAVVGHSHKIVPFIVYTRLRSKGVRTNRSGGPLLFGDLYRKGPAWTVLASMVLGYGAVLLGIVTASSSIAAIGGGLIAIAGVVVAVNLTLGPRFAVAPPDPGSQPILTPVPRKETT
jgi:hypothetical protein